MISEAEITALPTDTIAPGFRLCRATGRELCPVRAPVVNRLADGRLALWSPGTTVMLWSAGDTVPALLGEARPGGVYHRAVAVASAGRGRFSLVTLQDAWRLVTIDERGNLVDSTTIPSPGPMTSVGFVGAQAVRQRVAGWGADTAGHFTVALLDRITDQNGRVILDHPLRWATSRDTLPPVQPFIASMPSWTLTSNGDVVWSPGDQFVVERRGASGETRWRVEGPAGMRVSDTHLYIVDSLLREATAGYPIPDTILAEMRSKSDTLLPAVSGLTVTPSGDVVVARGRIPGATMIEYLRISADGTPMSRFTLDARAQVLVAEGDSILVHRPTEGEPWEVRWLNLMRMQ